MSTLFLAAAFLQSAPAVFAEYIYVVNATGWFSAQKYCRDNYVDLVPVMTHKKGERLLRGKIQGELWTGLYHDGTHWMWSGGTEAHDLPWAYDQSDAAGGCGSGCWLQCLNGVTGLRRQPCDQPLPFLCYNLIAPQEKETWEEALSYCRDSHSELTVLQSKTEHLLALSKVKKGPGPRVWIGLRFLANQWMWINGRRFGFRAWNWDQQHHCPALNRCGTLTRDGQWESWDCMDKLHFLCQ